MSVYGIFFCWLKGGGSSNSCSSRSKYAKFQDCKSVVPKPMPRTHIEQSVHIETWQFVSEGIQSFSQAKMVMVLGFKWLQADTTSLPLHPSPQNICIEPLVKGLLNITNSMLELYKDCSINKMRFEHEKKHTAESNRHQVNCSDRIQVL